MLAAHHKPCMLANALSYNQPRSLKHTLAPGRMDGSGTDKADDGLDRLLSMLNETKHPNFSWDSLSDSYAHTLQNSSSLSTPMQGTSLVPALQLSTPGTPSNVNRMFTQQPPQRATPTRIPVTASSPAIAVPSQTNHDTHLKWMRDGCGMFGTPPLITETRIPRRSEDPWSPSLGFGTGFGSGFDSTMQSNTTLLLPPPSPPNFQMHPAQNSHSMAFSQQLLPIAPGSLPNDNDVRMTSEQRDAWPSNDIAMLCNNVAAQADALAFPDPATRMAWVDRLAWDQGQIDRGRSGPFSGGLSTLLNSALPAIQQQRSMELSATFPSFPVHVSTENVVQPSGHSMSWCSNCTMPLNGEANHVSGTDITMSVCPYCKHPTDQMPTTPMLTMPPTSLHHQAEILDSRTSSEHEPIAVPHATSLDLVDRSLPSPLKSMSEQQQALIQPVVMSVASETPEAFQHSVALGYDDRMLLHCEPVTFGGREHPERPARLTSIMQALSTAGLLQKCKQVAGRPATDAELSAVHDPELIRQVDAASDSLTASLTHKISDLSMVDDDARVSISTTNNDAAHPGMKMEETTASGWPIDTAKWVIDCPMNEHTSSCARIAAGTSVDVVLSVLSGKADHGAAIIRPPGHHAESALSMGFCIYNNVAVAARAAQKAGAKRVLIMDWDVHHGNGTQNMFYDDDTVLFISTHRYDGGYFYPGTGSPREVGSGKGAGYTVNVGWPGPGMTDTDYMTAFRHVIMPIATAYKPDIVLISAGCDAAAGDPLGECLLTPQLYGHMTQMLMSVGPCVLLLEGGYNLSVTAACTAECVRVLLQGTTRDLPSPQQCVSHNAMAALVQTLQTHSQYWPVLQDHLKVLLEEQQAMNAAETPFAASGLQQDLHDAVGSGPLLESTSSGSLQLANQGTQELDDGLPLVML